MSHDRRKCEKDMKPHGSDFKFPLFILLYVFVFAFYSWQHIWWFIYLFMYDGYAMHVWALDSCFSAHTNSYCINWAWSLPTKETPAGFIGSFWFWTFFPPSEIVFIYVSFTSINLLNKYICDFGEKIELRLINSWHFYYFIVFNMLFSVFAISLSFSFPPCNLQPTAIH